MLIFSYSRNPIFNSIGTRIGSLKHLKKLIKVNNHTDQTQDNKLKRKPSVDTVKVIVFKKEWSLMG